MNYFNSKIHQSEQSMAAFAAVEKKEKRGLIKSMSMMVANTQLMRGSAWYQDDQNVNL